MTDKWRQIITNRHSNDWWWIFNNKSSPTVILATGGRRHYNYKPKIMKNNYNDDAHRHQSLVTGRWLDSIIFIIFYSFVNHTLPWSLTCLVYLSFRWVLEKVEFWPLKMLISWIVFYVTDIVHHHSKKLARFQRKKKLEKASSFDLSLLVKFKF